jgi:hypothetical protein
VVIGTEDPTTGLQIYAGDDGLERWFSAVPIDEVAGVDKTVTIVVADMDGDGLKDITVGREPTGEFKGFKQTRQYEEGKFAWTQNHIPDCGDADGANVADMTGLAVAELLGGDEVPEVVAVSAKLSTVAVLQRDKSGLTMGDTYACLPQAFAAQGAFQQLLLLGSEPGKVLVTDLDRDGLSELVVLNKGSGNVAVLEDYAPEATLFQVAESKVVYYNVGPDPFRVWRFDQDQDGCDDLLVIHEGSAVYSWLRNPACDGNLVAAVDSPCPIDPNDPGGRLAPFELGVDDIDLKPDAFDDVVLLTETINVPDAVGKPVPYYPLWFYASRTQGGDGIVSTAEGAGLLPPEYAWSVTDFALGNVAKTSHPDVLVAFSAPVDTPTDDDPPDDVPEEAKEPLSRNAIAAMYWAGDDDMFLPVPAIDTVPFYAEPVAIALGDVHSLTPDNMVDFVTVHAEKGVPGSEGYRPPRVASYQVNASGTGAPFLKRDTKVGEPDGVGNGPIDAVMGPVTPLGDELNDVLVVNRQNQDVSVYMGTNQGLFADAFPAFGLGVEPLAVELVDWNADCFLDVAILTADNLAVAYWNDIAEVFEPAAFFYADDEAISLGVKNDAVKGAVELLVSDTNHDCRDDLVVLNKSRSQVHVFVSSGTKAPGVARPIPPVAFPTGSGPIRLAKGDLNGDACEDLAVLNGKGESITVLISGNCVACTPPVDCSGNP